MFRDYHFGLIVGLIAVLTNLFVVMGFSFLSPYTMGTQIRENIIALRMNSIKTAILLDIISFLLPSIVIMYYCTPIAKALQNNQFTDKLKVRLLNTPIFVSIASGVGWTFGVFSSLTLYIVSGNLDFDSYKNMFIRNVFMAVNAYLFCFVFIYYSLDYIIKKRYIPKVFQDNTLSTYSGVYKLSIPVRFFILFIATTVFPLALSHVVAVSSMLDTNNIQSLIVYHITIFFGLASSLYLVYLYSLSFKHPILELKSITDKVRNEDYLSVVKIQTVDEIGYLGESVNLMVKSLQEKDFIKDTFGRMVDPRIRDHLLKGNINLGGELVEATILFSDIRGFTSLSEKMKPEDVVRYLNEYFEKMSECIVSEGGVINKYMGDAIMALFGIPIHNKDHAKLAIQAGLKMRKERDKLSQWFVSNHLPELKTGIGIHTGVILAGNIGSSSRMEYTVIGDSVNVASRLESMCKETKKDFLISGTTYQKVKDYDFPLEFLDEKNIRGKEERIQIYYAV